MSKTASGSTLVFGLVVVAIGGVISATATSVRSTPSQDWLYDLLNYFGIAIILAGIGMFFFGSMFFSRKN
jgi:hypothetical protein